MGEAKGGVSHSGGVWGIFTGFKGGIWLGLNALVRAGKGH